MPNPNQFQHVAPNEGKSLRVGPFGFCFKVSRVSNAGYAVAEVSVPPGARNAVHRHPLPETMVVLAGTLEFVGGDAEPCRVNPGSVVHVPANAPHGYTNVGDEPARLLVVMPPAQETLFDELGAAMAGDPDSAAVAQVMARHRVETDPQPSTTAKAACALLCLLVFAGIATLPTGCAASAPAKTDVVKRGELLVHVSACNDCHTPMKFDAKLNMPVPQMDRMLSGHPEGAPDPASALADGDQAVIGPTFTSFKLPFGISYSANLTPDATGIGGWTEAMFIGAMRTGRHMGLKGRPILPPMPWLSINELGDDDLQAIWAYLRSIPKVANRVSEPKVAAPALDEISQQYATILAGAPKQ